MITTLDEQRVMAIAQLEDLLAGIRDGSQILVSTILEIPARDSVARLIVEWQSAPSEDRLGNY